MVCRPMSFPWRWPGTLMRCMTRRTCFRPIGSNGFYTRNGVRANFDQQPIEAQATVSVTMDGRRRTFPMSPSDISVLDAAERAGLELPFSCRAGICATCRTKVTQGSVVMAHNIGLERWEIDAGFILCCQARPTTRTLELSYDEK